MRCSVLQCVAVCCGMLQFGCDAMTCVRVRTKSLLCRNCNAPMHCNALQCTATHCNALQRTATHCNALQRTATHCNTTATQLQHNCNALQRNVHKDFCGDQGPSDNFAGAHCCSEHAVRCLDARHLCLALHAVSCMVQCVAACCSVLQCVSLDAHRLRCLLCVAVCCSVLQCVAACCGVLQCFGCDARRLCLALHAVSCVVQCVAAYTATPCNTLQHPATHCNTLHHAATHCNTLQHTTTHCTALQHTCTRITYCRIVGARTSLCGLPLVLSMYI